MAQARRPREYFDDFPVCDTVKALILDGAARGGDKRQFVFRDAAGEEQEKSFRAVYEDTLGFAAYLWGRGFRKGEKLAILSENTYWWNVAFYGAQLLGAVTVPLDTGLAPENVAEQLADCGCGTVYTTERQAPKLPPAGAGRTYLYAADMEAYIAEGAAAGPAAREAVLAVPVSPDDLAAVVYTSGTTGRTKGVMLTHKNVCSNVYALLHLTPGAHGLGFLPLNHTYAWVTGLFATLVKGEWGYICTELKRIYKDIREYKPYQFAAVPMVVEMLYQNIILTAKRQGTYEKLMRGIEMSRMFMLSGYDARREMFAEIHEKFGGNLTTIYCGGAYLSPEIEQFMYDIGIQVITGYGLTECSPCVTCSRRYEFKIGSAGLPLECCEIRIADPDEDGAGEILVRGDNVMAGYYGDPEATAAAFDGEWLKTGDYGRIDEDGYLWFTGRKKNLIVLSNGKNVSPEEIEGRLTAGIDAVKEVVVRELDRRICAEIYLDEETYPDARKTIDAEVARVCDALPAHMRVEKVLLREEPFPKTATLKIRR